MEIERAIARVYFGVGAIRFDPTDLDLFAADNDSQWHPSVWIDRLVHGVLEFLGTFLAKTLPRIHRPRDVLHGMLTANRIGRAEVERTEVDRLEGFVVLCMECHADKAALEEVAAFDLNLDGAFGEISPLDPHKAEALAFADVNGVSSFCNAGDFATDRFQFSRSEKARQVDLLGRSRAGLRDRARHNRSGEDHRRHDCCCHK
jgi:hypothetical protein